MKLLFTYIGLTLLPLIGMAQNTSIQVNPDGSHTVIHNNGNTSTQVNPNGTHTITHNNENNSIQVNPHGSHTVTHNNSNASSHSQIETQQNTIDTTEVIYQNRADLPSTYVNNYYDNSAYATFGTVVWVSGFSGSYERTLFRKEEFRTRAKMSFLKYTKNNFDLEPGAKIYNGMIGLSAVQLIGLFEISVGAAYTSYSRSAPIIIVGEPIDYNPNEVFRNIVYIANLGLRYTNERFLLRAGFGNFEYLYLGLGINFD